MALKVYNTLTKNEEDFKPIKKGEVRMYSCGPTVYWYQHIGNLRAYMFVDVLKRVLSYNGLKVKHIINITDVGHLTSDADEGDDKMEKAVKREGKSSEEIANFYFTEFHNDLKKLNFIDPLKWTKATEHINEQIDLIKKLVEKGYTYRTEEALYFDVSKLADYGKLTGQKLDEQKAGMREDVILDKTKRNPQDFALWFFIAGHFKNHILKWDSPWGEGFPGWHIECSAMSMKYLGKHFDIHTGGQDHIPVHHTNEIAQNEAATGKEVVNYWMHNAWLVNKDGSKISKSTGGLYVLSDLEKMGFDPLAFRYFCLLTHYRKPLVFTIENLEAASKSFGRLKRKVVALKSSKDAGKLKSNGKEYEKEFEEAINDDLNTPKAVQVAQKAIDDDNLSAKARMALIERFDEVLGLGVKDMAEEEEADIPEEIMQLAAEREKARKAKDWKKSDKLRDEIASKGYKVEDTSEGQKVGKL